MTIDIPNEIFDIYEDGINALYNNTNIGETCKIYYPASKAECPNCVFNPYGGGTNVYKSGGPIGFSFGPCPVCNGVGFKEVEITENVVLRVYWNPKSWVKMNGIDKPDGKVQIIGKVENLPKIIRANVVEVFSDQDHLSSWKYNLDGEPILFGFGHRQFVALLKRI